MVVVHVQEDQPSHTGSAATLHLLYYCSNPPHDFPQLQPTCKVIWTPNPQPSFPPHNNGFILSFIRACALPLFLNHKLVPHLKEDMKHA